MDRSQLTEFFEKKTAYMIDTMKRKNADYSGAGGTYAFGNFKHVEDLGIATTEQGFLTRMTDKLCRITNLTTQVAQVKDESIEDTLIDLANYSLLFAAYLRSKQYVGKTPVAEVCPNCHAANGFTQTGIRDLWKCEPCGSEFQIS